MENPNSKEQELLRKMYECHDDMAFLLDKGEDDPDYIIMGRLIARLEKHIENNQDPII